MSAGDGSGHRLGVETSSGEAGPLPQHDEAGWEARELQPTGLTEDGSYLLLVAADDRGTHFRVRADERLRGLTRGATGRPNPYQPRVDSALTPREIQARLRAGQTASEVARAAGVPVERIQRYEAPVLAERARVVEQAQAARPPVRAEEPRRPLGEIVAERLGQRGIPEDAVHWDASRRVDGAWTIQMTFPRDETTVTACWLWDPAVGRVRPHDDEAAALLDRCATRQCRHLSPCPPRCSPRRAARSARSGARRLLCPPHARHWSPVPSPVDGPSGPPAATGSARHSAASSPAQPTPALARLARLLTQPDIRGARRAPQRRPIASPPRPPAPPRRGVDSFGACRACGDSLCRPSGPGQRAGGCRAPHCPGLRTSLCPNLRGYRHAPGTGSGTAQTRPGCPRSG